MGIKREVIIKNKQELEIPFIDEDDVRQSVLGDIKNKLHFYKKR